MQKLIKKIVDFSRTKKQSKDFTQFVEIFYLQNQERDFSQYSVEELYKNTLPSFEFFQNKKAGQFKIRTDNSSQKNYTIIEIVNDDMPFLVDSIAALIKKFDIEIKNVIHPIYAVSRDKSGSLTSIVAKDVGKLESLIQVHIHKISDKNCALLEKEIAQLLETIKVVVADWKEMLSALKASQAQIKNYKKQDAEISEIKDFISWIIEGNFILLGFKEFDFAKSKNEYTIKPLDSSSLGVFRAPHPQFKPNVANFSSDEIAHSIKNPYVVEVVKSSYKSKIHRASNAERIRIQKFSPQGEVIGEYRIIGLFTSSAYTQTPKQIPLIKGKINEVIKASGFVQGSHNYKDLVSAIESYPRDELFQISKADLLRISTSIVAICGRDEVRFFARKDNFSRFISCLVFVPRERSNSELREKICNYLAQEYQGEVVDVFVQITESNLTRLHVIIKTDATITDLRESSIEVDISQMTKLWSEFLKEEIAAKFGDNKSLELFAKYKNAFSISY